MTVLSYSKLSCEVTYCGETLSAVPFVIDQNGQPFESLNFFVRGQFPDWKKKQGSIGQTVDRVLAFFQLLHRNQRRWDEATHDYVALRVKELEKQELGSATINAHTNAIYAFYWMCEKRGFCSGLIGINDVDQNDYGYPLHVLYPRNPRREYDNPFIRRSKNKTLRADITKTEDWEAAYTKALDADTPASHRDAALMLLILQSGARRIEALSLTIGSFRQNVRPEQRNVHISVLTKRYETRTLLVPVETYLGVREFINDERPALISDRRKDHGAVFCGENGLGKALSKNHLSKRLRDIYGVAPKDGRSTFATNLMIELYRAGYSMDSAILLVRERMGHSATDETARTLRAHYLQAQAIVQAHENGTELERARGKIANLGAEVSKRDDEIQELKEKVRQLTLAQSNP